MVIPDYYLEAVNQQVLLVLLTKLIFPIIRCFIHSLNNILNEDYELTVFIQCSKSTISQIHNIGKYICESELMQDEQKKRARFMILYYMSFNGYDSVLYDICDLQLDRDGLKDAFNKMIK